MENLKEYTAAFNNGFTLGMMQDYSQEGISLVLDALRAQNESNSYLNGLSDGHKEGQKRLRNFELIKKREDYLKALFAKETGMDKNLGR